MSVTRCFIKEKPVHKSLTFTPSPMLLCVITPQLSKPECFQRKGSDRGRSGNFKIDRSQTGTRLNRMRKCQSACLLVVIIEKGVALLHWFTVDTSKSVLVTSSLAGHQLLFEFMAFQLMFHISRGWGLAHLIAVSSLCCLQLCDVNGRHGSHMTVLSSI